MPRRTIAVVSAAIALAIAGTASAQPAPARHLTGRSISEGWRVEPGGQTKTATVTLEFQADDGGAVVTVDFVTRLVGREQRSAPGVVDIIVTEHPREDNTPEMRMKIDGRAEPLTTRLHSRRSIATSVPFDEFVRLTAASSLIEEAFGAELEFSPGQLRMLRFTADRWAGR